MKKSVIILMAMMGALNVQADTTYPYLTFELTDGTKASVSVSSLTLSVSGTTLTAGSQSFTLSNLSKMYFSTTDNSTSGVTELNQMSLEEATEIYDLKGNKVTKDQMKRGAYIIKTKNRTYKVVVK